MTVKDSPSISAVKAFNSILSLITSLYITKLNQDVFLIALILVCNTLNETLFPVEIME